MKLYHGQLVIWYNGSMAIITEAIMVIIQCSRNSDFKPVHRGGKQLIFVRVHEGKKNPTYHIYVYEKKCRSQTNSEHSGGKS